MGIIVIGVFGAGGFIGRSVTRALSVGGHEVMAFARSFREGTTNCPGVRYVEGDFRDRIAVSCALNSVDTVIQLVSSSSPARVDVSASMDIRENVIPHADFLDLCAGAAVERYVFISSGGTVYGPDVKRAPITEDASTNPISSHGLTKLMVEKLIFRQGYLTDLEYVILRVSNAYGPGQVVKNGQGLIPALLDHHEKGEPIHIFGDGSAARDYIYIEDLARAVKAAVELPGRQQHVLNIGSGTAHTVLDVVHTLQEVAGIELQIEHLPPRGTDVPSVWLDVAEAARVLGWAPRMSFREGLARTVAWRAGGTP